MTTDRLFHGTFTLKRTWATAPARVFSAWSDPEVKAQWFTGPPGEWSLIKRSIDFRAGGVEVLQGRFNKTGMVTLFQARFHLIKPDRRLIYDYDLYLGGRFHSVTLSSLVLEPEGGRTHIAYTEQIVFLDGRDGTAGREHGVGLQLDAIERLLVPGGGTQ